MTRKELLLNTLILFVLAAIILFIFDRLGQGDVMSLGDLTVKRLFKAYDRAPEPTVIAWFSVCAMLLTRILCIKR